MTIGTRTYYLVELVSLAHIERNPTKLLHVINTRI
jgi:hypothetical protein